jgi:hypothetical protein
MISTAVNYYQFVTLFEQPSLEVSVEPIFGHHRALNMLTSIQDALKKGTLINNTGEQIGDVVDKIYRGFKAKYDRQVSRCCQISSCCLPCLFDGDRYQVEKLRKEIGQILSKSRSSELTLISNQE